MLTRILNGLLAAGGAAAAAQFPAFYRQYLQHLTGRLEQASADLAPVVRDAAARGLDLDAYLERARAEGGELTATLVAGYQQAFETLQRLQAAVAALARAGPLERPLAFARHFDPATAESTAAGFSPALPLSAEGVAYAGAGLVAGIALAWAVEQPVRIAARRRRRSA